MNASLRSLLGLVLLLSLGSVVYPLVGLPYLLILFVGGGLAWRARAGESFSSWFQTLDDLIFAGERSLVAFSLAVMAVVVFLDVIWRAASGLDASTTRNFAVGGIVLVLLGALTARAPGVSWPKRLAIGGVVAVLIGGSVFLIVQAENGFGWSQRLALVLVVWVGLIGGSMATREDDTSPSTP